MRFKIPGNRNLWLLLGLCSTLAMGFVLVAEEISEMHEPGDDEIRTLDDRVFAFARFLSSGAMTKMMRDLTSLGSVSVLVLVAVAVGIFLLSRRDFVAVLHLFVAGFGASFIPLAFKNYFIRDRPDIAERLVEVSGHSFPSGHRFGSAAIYFTLAFFATRHVEGFRNKSLFYVMAGVIVALVGFSRIYLGVHYASDVVAGLLAGSAWSFFVMAVFMSRYENALEKN